MPYKERRALINEIEALRGSKVICYLTSVRPGAGAQIGQDAVRVFFDHLLLLQQRPVERLDIFICSNGGDGVVPWRLVSLFREFAKQIGVIVPYRAYSAATMLALGADEIVMHPFAEMGPIDPTVSNDFNPVDPQTHQRVGISVEDVKAYVAFIKETVGIHHEDELIRAIEILAQKVHPLALGNVERFIAQSRMIARKLLLTHMKEEEAHKIDQLIETLASKLYFHGHPINRREASEQLGLKAISDLPAALETAIWKLYLEYEAILLNNQRFDPMAEIFSQVAAGTAIIPVGTHIAASNALAVIECPRLSSLYQVDRRFVVTATSPQNEPIIRAETLRQAWVQSVMSETESVATEEAVKPETSSPPIELPQARQPAPEAKRKKKARRGALVRKKRAR